LLKFHYIGQNWNCTFGIEEKLNEIGIEVSGGIGIEYFFIIIFRYFSVK